MSVAVKCEICGKLFNSRFLSSHTRRAHPKGAASSANRPEARANATEQELAQEILSIFDRLSPAARKEVLHLLATPARKPH